MGTAVYFAETTAGGAREAAYALLTRAMGGVLPEISRAEHGKPYFPALPQVWFSLSHTRGAAVCAVSDAPVGADVEWPRPVRPELAARCFTAAERVYALDAARFLEVWTRKEALLKRDGSGISVPLDRVETMDHPQIFTWRGGVFTVSVCCAGEISLRETVPL